jgi:hypothetical protein
VSIPARDRGAGVTCAVGVGDGCFRGRPGGWLCSRRRCRHCRCRSRSASRYAAMSFARLRLACCRRRTAPHSGEHTFCLALARTSPWYHCRHAEQRRRCPFVQAIARSCSRTCGGSRPNDISANARISKIIQILRIQTLYSEC